MLVLERKSGESIVIQNGDDVIEIKIDKEHKGAVKLAFDAPMHYIILRKELTLNKEKK
jgi:carbon storage regulator CsrA